MVLYLIGYLPRFLTGLHYGPAPHLKPGPTTPKSVQNPISSRIVAVFLT